MTPDTLGEVTTVMILQSIYGYTHIQRQKIKSVAHPQEPSPEMLVKTGSPKPQPPAPCRSAVCLLWAQRLDNMPL